MIRVTFRTPARAHARRRLFVYLVAVLLLGGFMFAGEAPVGFVLCCAGEMLLLTTTFLLGRLLNAWFRGSPVRLNRPLSYCLLAVFLFGGIGAALLVLHLQLADFAGAAPVSRIAVLAGIVSVPMMAVVVADSGLIAVRLTFRHCERH